MNYAQICKPIKNELNDVEKGLRRLFPADDTFVSHDVAHILNAGGKRLRPALLLTAAQACNGAGKRSVRMAIAVELLHTATLIHDDVVDGHGLRRGVATMNSRCGNAISVLNGDYLYSKAFEIFANDSDIDIMRCIASTTNRIAKGELVQLQVRGDITMTEERYLSIIADKTASLISCACRIGAMMGEAFIGAADGLARFGHNLGMAFQIVDDLLDFTGSEDVLGKPVGSDLREGKVTLPLIHTIRVAGKKDKQWIENVLASRAADARAVRRMGKLVKHHEGIDYSLLKANEYVKACKKEIDIPDLREISETLALFADYSIRRVR
jgi:octaprenyl-diphosphate synthase